MTVALRCALAALVVALPLCADDDTCPPDTPCYSAAGVVNSANYTSGWLAPTTYATIFGLNLSHVTETGVPGAQGVDGALGGVRVRVNDSVFAFVSYVSPDQVNFVVPSGIPADWCTVRIMRDNLAGPLVTLTLHDSAPALFHLDPATAVAAHQDWSLVTEQAPARAGEVIVLYATGLGQFARPVPDMQRPSTVNWIARLSEFQLYLDGQPVDPNLIYYVGAAPVSVGLVQIDLELPASVGRNPEIRIALGDRLSPPGVHLPVE